MSIALFLVACGTTGDEVDRSSEPSESSSTETEASGAESLEDSEGQGSNILVAYFTWADNAILADDVDAITSPSVIAPGKYSSWPVGFRRKQVETPVLHTGNRPVSKRLG